MNEISSKQYSKDEVDRIIRRALKLTKNDSINHQELIDTAKEFGDPIPEPKGQRLMLA